jgi:ATP-binding protein involved in chromosome partitioning
MTDDIIDRLKAALPELAAARLQSLRLSDGVATAILDVVGLDRLERDRLEIAVKDALRGQEGVSEVRVAMMADKPKRQIVAVGSGKGGVGKSTLSANLAVALAGMGRKVGLADAHLAEPGQAIAWRGPMAGNALSPLIDADWGDAEILIVDLPPGTGDVQLTMLQRFKPTGALIVSTPQDLALMDAMRAIGLFEQGEVPVIGMVENMAGYACPHCGEVSDPFGAGGAEAAAVTMGHAFLGRIPLDLEIRLDSDGGRPVAVGDGPQAEAFAAIARRVATWLANQGGKGGG